MDKITYYFIILALIMVNCADPGKQGEKSAKNESKDLFKMKVPEKKKNIPLSNHQKTSPIEILKRKSKDWSKFAAHKAVIMNIENSRLNGHRSNIDEQELQVSVANFGKDKRIILHFEKIIPKSNWHIVLDFSGPLKVGTYPLTSGSNFGYFESLSIDDYFASSENKTTLDGKIEIIKSDGKVLMGQAKFIIPVLSEYAMSTDKMHKEFENVKVDLAFYTTDL